MFYYDETRLLRKLVFLYQKEGLNFFTEILVVYPLILTGS